MCAPIRHKPLSGIYEIIDVCCEKHTKAIAYRLWQRAGFYNFRAADKLQLTNIFTSALLTGLNASRPTVHC